MLDSQLKSENLIDFVARVEVRLYGSLSLTRKGHGTDKVILFVLQEESEIVEIETIDSKVKRVAESYRLQLARERSLSSIPKNNFASCAERSSHCDPTASSSWR